MLRHAGRRFIEDQVLPQAASVRGTTVRSTARTTVRATVGTAVSTTLRTRCL